MGPSQFKLADLFLVKLVNGPAILKKFKNCHKNSNILIADIKTG